MKLQKVIVFAFVSIVFFFFFIPEAHATTYYVDPDITDSNVGSATPDCTNYDSTAFVCSGGSDSAYVTFADINAGSFSPGDSILFKRGEEWVGEQLTIPSSGSVGNLITIGAYGSGDKPKCRNVLIKTGWTSYSSNTWQANEWWDPEQVFMDDGKLTEGADKDSLNDHEWVLDGDNDKLYLRDESGDPDLTGVLIEASKRWSCVTINDKSYIKVENLELEKANGPNVYVHGDSSYIYLEGLTTDRGIDGIWVYADATISNVYINNCDGNRTYTIESDDSEITNCSLGNTGGDDEELILVKGARVLVENNTVANARDRGIWLGQSGDDCIVRGNTVYGTTTGGEGWAMGIDIDGYGTSGIGGVLVEDNIIYDSGGIGLQLENTDDSPIVRRNKIYDSGSDGIRIIAYDALQGVNFSGSIYNNLVYNNDRGLGIYSTAGWDIYNNTFAGSTDEGVLVWYASGFPEYDTDINFKNNIVQAENTPIAFREDWDVLDAHDYNIYFGVDKFTTSSPYAEMTLAQFQTETGQEANSSYEAPGFVDAANDNYTLQTSSSGINAGVDVGLTEDFASNSVPQGSAPDIGAYEFLLPSSPSPLSLSQSGSNLTFSMTMASSNSSDSLSPQVEIQPAGNSFTNTANYSGSAVSYSGSNVSGTVIVSNYRSGGFHWQARASNAAGQSSWVSGNNFFVDFPSSGAPTCGNQSPTAAPWLYGATSQSEDSMLLSFTDASDNVDKYAIEFGTTSGEYKFAADNIAGKGSGAYLVQSLQPNTTYYFRVRAGNGCATGPWSNEISATTYGSGTSTRPDTLKQGNLKLEITDVDTVDKVDDSEDTTEKENKKVKGYLVQIKVVDTQQKPVGGATVTLHSDPKTTTTNEEGVASFDDVEPGDHRIAIEYDGQSGEKSVTLTGDSIEEFQFTVQIEPTSPFRDLRVIAAIGGLIVLLIVVVAVFIFKSRSQ